jgi:hypothetical protein
MTTEFEFRDPNGPDIANWAGYIKFLQGRGVAFDLVPVAELLSMTPSARQEYDSARLEFLSDNIVVENETVLNITETLETVMRLNHGKPTGGYGVFASAAAGRGKTTALHSVLREVLTAYLAYDPTCIAENRCCPVAYICVPDSGTPKSVYMEIAGYLGVECKPRDSDPVMRKIVLAGIANSGIQVFVIDEVQNLENGGPFAKRAADAVRRLVDDTKATFILAGINVEKTSIMSRTRGLQTANRFIRAEVADYGKRSVNWKGRWKGLVGAMADALPLYGDTRQEMEGIAGPLYEACGGSVQALNLMATQASRQLIGLGDHTQETITLERLQGTLVNLATEQHIRTKLERARKRSAASAKAARPTKSSPAAKPEAATDAR